MDIEVQGSCHGPLNVKVIKLHYAHLYGVEKGLTYGKACKQLTIDGVDPALWPSEQQIKTQRKSLTTGVRHYASVCVGALDHFLRNLPDNIHLFKDHVVRTENCVRIPFATKESLQFINSCNLQCFLMDFTFQTNCEGLLLGGAGPVGLRTDSVLPHMRFAPVVLMLADSEDDDARRLTLDILFSLRPAGPKAYTDGFLDCTCLETVMKHYGECFYLHRCLEHVKRNIKSAAAHRDKKHGTTRLKKMELKDVIVGWVDFAAWLPSDEDFDCYMRSILDRMRNARSGRPISR